MAQTFRFLCALLLLGAFCELTKTEQNNNTTSPTTTPGGNTTIPPTTPGSNATIPPTTPGSNATIPPTTPGSNTTIPPTTPGSNATIPPTTPGSNATIPPTTPGSNATIPPTTPGGNTNSPPAPTPGGNTTSPPAPTPGGNTTSPPAPTPGDACLLNPCSAGSTCEPRAGGTFECLCPPGTYYNQIFCVTAKVFPGELTFGNILFNESLTDKTSVLFQKTSQEVTGRIRQVFEDDETYLNSTVLEFRPAQTRNQQTTASVHIVFNLNATIDESTVFERIKNCSACNVTSFARRTLCDDQPCDLMSTTCEASGGSFTCRCNSGYVITNISNLICIACPSGQRALDNRCVDCSFGYSGFNCAEHWKLALVIVASVLGAVLLITLIALVTVVVRSKKRSKASSTAAIGKPYNSHSPANSPLVHDRQGAPAMTGMPRIPRATAQNSAGFNLEMTPSNSRQNLVSSGGNSSNPYTSNRGQDNPYYKYDGR